jgi:hypothetical protein
VNQKIQNRPLGAIAAQLLMQDAASACHILDIYADALESSPSCVVGARHNSTNSTKVELITCRANVFVRRVGLCRRIGNLHRSRVNVQLPTITICPLDGVSLTVCGGLIICVLVATQSRGPQIQLAADPLENLDLFDVTSREEELADGYPVDELTFWKAIIAQPHFLSRTAPPSQVLSIYKPQPPARPLPHRQRRRGTSHHVPCG